MLFTNLRPRHFVFAILASSLPALAAAPITGTVTNRTTNKPAAGDTVVLIRLAQGMQESTHTTTDAHGRFSLDVPDEGVHLIRVTHDKANYFRPAPPGTQSVDLDVYNAAPHVKGVSTEAVVMRVQTDGGGNGLTVVENIFIKNDSNPPLTQFSENPFDFYLPEGAVVQGSAALAPGGMPVQTAPVPLADKGHYTFLFPIRPGETRFQISYRLPYNGKFTFAPKISSAVDTVALMMPKSMTFTSVSGSPFTPVNDDVNAQTLVARSVTPDSPLGFTVSGSGQLPRDEGQSEQAAQGGAASGNGPADNGQSAASADTRPGGGLGNPLDPNGDHDPWGKYKGWILAGLALLLAVGAALLLRRPAGSAAASANALPPSQLPPAAYAVAASPAAKHQVLLEALKEELFALETDHLQNRISAEDYAQQKAALELVLRRALARNNAGAA